MGCGDVTVADPTLSLELEKVRLLWQHASMEVDAHRQRYLRLFAVFVTVGLAAVATVLLERVAVVPGSVLALATFGIAGYAYVRILQLPAQLLKAVRTAVDDIDRLMTDQEE